MSAFDDLQVQMKQMYEQSEADRLAAVNDLASVQDQLAKTEQDLKDALAQKTPSQPHRLMIGAASADFSQLENKSGPQHVKRVYDPGFNKDFMAVCKSAGVNPVGITVVYSCKPASGLKVPDVAGFLSTVPGTTHLIIEVQHEASNPKKSFTTQAQRDQLRTDKRLFYQMALNAGHDTIWIEMDYLWQAACGKANSWRTPENFNPGDDLTTYYGVDTYNNGSLLNPQRWDSFGYAIGDPVPTESLSHVGGGYVEGGFLNYAKAHGKPWMVTEWNTIRDLPAGYPGRKGQYLIDGADYFYRKGASALLLFDTNGRTSAINGESWPLKNDTTGADYAAWAEVNASY